MLGGVPIKVINPPSNVAKESGIRISEAGRPLCAACRKATGSIKAKGGVLSPQDFVRECLDGAGAMVVSDGTFENLVAHAETQGDIRFDRAEVASCSESRIAEMLQLIVATREYQLA